MKIYQFPVILMVISLALSSCNDDDVPEAEPDEEIITDVRLIFSPVSGGGAPAVFIASDPDGQGINDLEPEGPISLDTNTSYQLFIQLENNITGEDITEEIEEEGDEHMFFFGFTEGLFANPSGDGNIDAREPQSVEYADSDNNGLPIGLITAWVTGEAMNGTFRVILKHQPNTKSATSTASDGSTDVDITWQVTID